MQKKTRRIIMWGIAVLILIVVVTGGTLVYFSMKMSRNEEPQWWYWESQVKAVEDKYHGDYPQNAIIFAGSSFIEKWKTLPQDMAPLTVLNNGISGTKIADSVFYVDRLVVPFNPKAIVLYAGSNDINGVDGNSKTGEEVYKRVVEYFTNVHKKLPSVPIYYISIAPTPSRMDVWPEAEKANQLINQYCEDHKNEHLIFIEATTALLNEDGTIKKEIYGIDNLHFNQQGYEIWTVVINPILAKDLGQK